MPEPKTALPKDDPSLSELARAMASEEPAPEVVDDGSGGVVDPPKPKAASKEKEETPASQEKPKVEEGESGEKEEKEGDEDPLKGIDITKPEEAVKALLKIPGLAPALQSWSDGGVAAQVEAARQRDRPAIEASERERAAIEAANEHFAPMSQEDIAEEISKDPKAATSYAQYQARLQQGAGPDPSGVAAASTVYAFTAQVAQNNKLLKESDLPAEKKEELAGNNFTQHGPDGILLWGEAIQTALIEQKAGVRAEELLNEKWETFKEEKLVELDGDRPPVVRGSRTSPVPDLLGEDSSTQMEHAFAQDEGKK